MLLVLARRKSSWIPGNEWLVLLLLAIQLHYTLSRPDAPHSMALFPTLAVLVLCSLAEHLKVGLRVAIVVVAVSFPAALYNLLLMRRELATQYVALQAISKLLETGDAALYGGCYLECDPFRVDRSELAAVDFVRSRTADHEPVFSGLTDHGRFYSNDMRAYWLMRRPAGTRHVMMMRGVSTGPLAEAEIIADLQRRKVSWLVLWSPDIRTLPAAETDSILDAFIRRHFEPTAHFGSHEVWRRSAVLAVSLAPEP